MLWRLASSSRTGRATSTVRLIFAYLLPQDSTAVTIPGDHNGIERRDSHQEEAGEGVRHPYKGRIATFSSSTSLVFRRCFSFCNMVLRVKLTLFLRLQKLALWSYILHDIFDMFPVLEGLPVECQQAGGVPLPASREQLERVNSRTRPKREQKNKPWP